MIILPGVDAIELNNQSPYLLHFFWLLEIVDVLWVVVYSRDVGSYVIATRSKNSVKSETVNGGSFGSTERAVLFPLFQFRHPPNFMEVSELGQTPGIGASSERRKVEIFGISVDCTDKMLLFWYVDDVAKSFTFLPTQSRR